jgi:hypothetical protein
MAYVMVNSAFSLQLTDPGYPTYSLYSLLSAQDERIVRTAAGSEELNSRTIRQKRGKAHG